MRDVWYYFATGTPTARTYQIHRNDEKAAVATRELDQWDRLQMAEFERGGWCDGPLTPVLHTPVYEWEEVECV